MRNAIATTILITLACSAVAAQVPVAPKAAKPPAKHGDTAATMTDVLTNDEIIQLTDAGLAVDVVITAIRQAPNVKFDTRPANLVELKRRRVADAVISAMQQRSTGAEPRSDAAASPAPTPGPAAKATVPAHGLTGLEGPGIYVEGLRNGVPGLVPLEPTVFSQGKTGGVLTSAMTYGLKKAKWKAIMKGSGAQLRLSESQPTFYFYFVKDGSGLSQTGSFTGWLSGASSPNEFVLARMTSKDRERELVVGEFGAFGASSGTRSKDTVDLEFIKVAPGLYKVKPRDTFAPGEYCFFYAAGASSGMGGGTAGKLFDFGVDSGR